jgi:hypothetical protein
LWESTRALSTGYEHQWHLRELENIATGVNRKETALEHRVGFRSERTVNHSLWHQADKFYRTIDLRAF